MALFGSKEDKAAQAAEKEKALLQKYGIESLYDSQAGEVVRKIAAELTGTGLMEAGMKLSMTAKTEDQLTVQYLRAIVEQNFLIIRLLDALAEK